jgi:hypothetical protein
MLQSKIYKVITSVHTNKSQYNFNNTQVSLNIKIIVSLLIVNQGISVSNLDTLILL